MFLLLLLLPIVTDLLRGLLHGLSLWTGPSNAVALKCHTDETKRVCSAC